MRHTIDEAASLVGRTRRSLYRAMTKGRLSYGLQPDGRRYIDTAELLRVYGPFEPPSHGVTLDASHGVTLDASHGVTVPGDLGDVIARAVAEALEPLRKEIEQLREMLLRIEHKPPPPPAGRSAPQSFADLLEGLGD